MKIVINNTGIPEGLIDIAEQLPNPSEVASGSDVVLHFSGNKFIYVTGLVLLTTWRKALPAGVKVHVDDRACTWEAQSFLTNTGFREIIDTGHETPSTQKRIGRVPIQPITSQFSKEATVNDIVSIFDEYSGHVEDSSPFKVMLSELCENVLTHSEFTSPGYVCARVSSIHSGKVEIAIADSGVGIHQSYINGTNDGVKEKLKKGAIALELALDGFNSSKPTAPQGSLRSYYGFGLMITRRLVEENRGQIFVMSGDDTLFITRDRRKTGKLKKPFTGTFIGIVLDLNNPLPLEEIYEKATEEYTGHPHQKGPTATLKAQAISGRKKQADELLSSRTDTNQISESDEAVQQVKNIELRHYGTELLTRDAGTAIRADIAGYLAAGYKVEVSLDDVTDITPSVADEAFAKLAQVVGQEIFEKRVHIVGGTQLANRLVNFVLKTRRN